MCHVRDILHECLGNNFVSGLRILKLKNFFLKTKPKNLKTFSPKETSFFQPYYLLAGIFLAFLSFLITRTLGPCSTAVRVSVLD